MVFAKIIARPENNSRHILTITTNTSTSQRETLEEIIINFATLIDAKIIYKTQNARGSYFYEVQASGFTGFQSASNTILELSPKLSKQT